MLESVLYPLIAALKFIYLSLASITGSYGLALILLSCITSSVVMLLGRLLRGYSKREHLIQTILAPQLSAIKAEGNAAIRHRRVQALYRRYGYHPAHSLRSAVPLLLQLPFLFAAFYLLSKLNVLQGKSLFVIKDLASPDKLLWGINLLPLLMTAINVLSAIFTTGFKTRDKTQSFIIAFLFLVLLYNAPAALLVYWTMNNMLFLFKTLLGKHAKPELRLPKEPVVPLKLSASFTTQFGVALRQYFGLILLFYLYQAIAMQNYYVFSGFFKYIPLCLAAYMFWILQVKDLLKCYKPTLQHNLALLVLGFDILFFVILGLNFVAPIVELKPQIYVMFCYLASLLGLSGFMIGALIKETLTKAELARTPYLLILVCACALIPGLHFAHVNPDYLKGWLHIMFAFCIALSALANYAVLLATCSLNSSKSRIALNSAVFSFAFIVLPLLRSFLKLRNDVDMDFWIMLALLLAVSHLIKSRRSFTILLRIVLITLTVFLVSYIFGMFSAPKTGKGKIKILTREMQNIKFLNKPNIYLFVYDGMPNERVFKQQGQPFDKLKYLIDKYGFKLYPDTYTIGEMSMDSMGNLLDFSVYWRARAGSATDEAQDTYSGNSFTNLILRQNEYTSHFLLENYYVGLHAITNTDLFDEIYPPRNPNQVRFDFLVTLLRGIFQGEMSFNVEGIVDKEEHNIYSVQAYKQALIIKAKKQAFIVNHYFRPGHSQNSGKCLPNETELWISRFKEAISQMERDFQAIAQHDPQAIVIAIGDHGPSLTGDCYRLASWKKSDITPDLIWDRIGTMVAIRWPDTGKAAKYDSLLVTNQDIFPTVFAYLMDSDAPLALCPDDVFYGFKTPTRSAIGFDKGVIVP